MENRNPFPLRSQDPDNEQYPNTQIKNPRSQIKKINGEILIACIIACMHKDIPLSKGTSNWRIRPQNWVGEWLGNISEFFFRSSLDASVAHGLMGLALLGLFWRRSIVLGEQRENWRLGLVRIRYRAELFIKGMILDVERPCGKRLLGERKKMMAMLGGRLQTGGRSLRRSLREQQRSRLLLSLLILYSEILYLCLLFGEDDNAYSKEGWGPDPFTLLLPSLLATIHYPSTTCKNLYLLFVSESLPMEKRLDGIKKNQRSFKKVLCSDNSFSKEQEENELAHSRPDQMPTMVSKTLKGGNLKMPFEAGLSGSKKGKSKGRLKIMKESIYNFCHNKPYEGYYVYVFLAWSAYLSWEVRCWVRRIGSNFTLCYMEKNICLSMMIKPPDVFCCVLTFMVKHLGGLLMILCRQCGKHLCLDACYVLMLEFINDDFYCWKIFKPGLLHARSYDHKNYSTKSEFINYSLSKACHIDCLNEYFIKDFNHVHKLHKNSYMLISVNNCTKLYVLLCIRNRCKEYRIEMEDVLLINLYRQIFEAMHVEPCYDMLLSNDNVIFYDLENLKDGEINCSCTTPRISLLNTVCVDLVSIKDKEHFGIVNSTKYIPIKAIIVGNRRRGFDKAHCLIASLCDHSFKDNSMNRFCKENISCVLSSIPLRVISIVRCYFAYKCNLNRSQRSVQHPKEQFIRNLYIWISHAYIFASDKEYVTEDPSNCLVYGRKTDVRILLCGTYILAWQPSICFSKSINYTWMNNSRSYGIFEYKILHTFEEERMMINYSSLFWPARSYEGQDFDEVIVSYSDEFHDEIMPCLSSYYANRIMPMFEVTVSRTMVMPPFAVFKWCVMLDGVGHQSGSFMVCGKPVVYEKCKEIMDSPVLQKMRQGLRHVFGKFIHPN